MRVECLHSRGIAALVALVLAVVPCVGQTNASLEVIVKDPSGALINKAQVQLLRNGKPQSLSATNQRGEARFNKIAAGTYQIHVEAPGFKAQDVDALELSSGAHRKEVTLEIEVIKVDVDVADEAQVRNTNPNGPAFSNVLTAEQIAQLPDDPEEFENAINQLAGPGASTDFAAASCRPSRRFAKYVFARILMRLRTMTRASASSISPPNRA